jgi:diacylglycerol kinase (ATP)
LAIVLLISTKSNIFEAMIAIFVNSTSGKGKALKVTETITTLLAAKNLPFTIYKDDWPNTIEAFDEVWIVGGDGTLNYFINKYPTATIPLTIFKGGTGNDFSWKLYGNISTEEQIEKVLATEPKKVDAAKCNNYYFINGVGIGFDGEVLKSMGAIRWLGGHLGYLVVVIKKIFSYKEVEFSISSSTLKIKNKFLLINIANSSRTGGGFLVSPLADVNDESLNVVLCNKLSILKRLRYLPVIEKGKHLALPFIQHHLTQKITIQTPQKVFAQLDGELIDGNIFEIEILKGRFLFKY